MEDTVNIKNLDKLLQPFLDNQFTISEYQTRRLTAAGENYGSLMLRVELKLREKNGSSKGKILSVVAKMCPPNEWLKKMFNTSVTFKKEIAMYNIVFPTFAAFQREQGVINVINCFPKCYGARANLESESDKVDDDAVLLLENLKLSGFDTVDRMKGFDLETTKLILKDLAVFHAVPIAIKLLQPNVFKTKILPHLQNLVVFDGVSEAAEKSMVDGLIDIAMLNSKCVPLIPRVRQGLKTCLHNFRNPTPPSEPFGTINHNDYWVNNTMIRFENDKPVENKMVDFQMIDYGSPADDVVFFLFSSVQKEVLDVYYEDFVKLYYDTFISTLKDLKCSTEPFTFELFQNEVNDCARTGQFFHVLLMLRPIYALKGTVKEISELSEADMLDTDQLSDEYKEKVAEIILEFSKRRWI